MPAQGITGRFSNAVKPLHVDTTRVVRVNIRLTEMFTVLNGVKQGCKLSPSLFSIFINDLVEDVIALGIGIPLDNASVMVSALLYADDFALIAPVENSLQTMLDTVSLWRQK